MTIVEQKKKLRSQISSLRSTIDEHLKEKCDRWICNTLQKIIIERNCKIVHCYLPMRSEVNIFPLIKFMLQRGIKVVAPKTLPKRQLQNLILKSLDELEDGVFGTVHPANSKIYLGHYDLIIVPGLAFDSNNFRLGYGGGYYDNFINSQPNAYTLGVCYPFQHIEQIPLETHDAQLDDVISPDFSDSLAQ